LPDSSLARLLTEKRNRKVFRRLVVVITILFLAGTGVTITLGNRIFSSKDNVSRPKVAEVSRKNKEASVPAVSVRQKVEAPKPADVVKEPDSEPEHLSKKEELLPLSSRDETALPVTAKALQKPATEPVRLTKKEEPIAPIPRTETALIVPVKTVQRTAPQIPARPSPSIEPRRSEALIPDLELQAIVWSENPGSRSAMINGRLVRLGEEVRGFTVDEIGRNCVYVKSGLRSGKLRMIGAR
jgi:hypothetical protein